MIWKIFPELFLFFSALGILLLGSFRPSRMPVKGRLHALSQGVLLVCFVLLLLRPHEAPSFLFGDLLRIDSFSEFLKMLCLLSGFVAITFLPYAFIPKKWDTFEWPVLILLSLVGMMVMLSASDLMVVYLGLEFQSLALYVLAAKNRDNERSAEAGLKYFVLGALASGLLLYGMSLIYGVVGGTSFGEIAEKISTLPQNHALFTLGVLFFLSGLAFKISAVPFHMWVPDVYEGAPTPITAFFSSAPKVAAVGLFFHVLSGPLMGMKAVWFPFVLLLSLFSLSFAAIAAIGQKNIKRLFAYSSIAHVGYILLAMVAGGEEGGRAVLFYLGIYVVTVFGIFACILMMRRGGYFVEKIEDLKGLSSTHPGVAFVFTLLLLSLAGVPPTAGFFAKYFVLVSALHAGLTIPALIAVVASVIGAFYYLRLIKMMYFDPTGLPLDHPPRVLRGVAYLAGGSVLLFLLFSTFYWNYITLTASGVLGF